MNIKTHIIFSLLLALVITCGFGYSQEKRETEEEQPIKFPITQFPPSPEASALGRFDEIPVDKSTGVVNIAIPLLELNEGGISIPITLSYHAGGIRVQDDPSWVGLGWALSTGGIISRTVRGRPDEFGKGFLQNAMKVPPTKAIFFGLNQSNLLNETHGLLKNIANGVTEFEPDLFHYSFGDKSGSFMFGNDMKIYTIPYNGLVIEPIFGAAGVAQVDKLKGFVILDDDGVQYFFGKVLDIEGDYTEKSQPENNGGDPPPPQHVSSWRLQKIINVFTKAEAVFHYSNFEYTTPEIFNESKTYIRLDNGQYSYKSHQDEEHWAMMNLLQLNKIQMNNKTVTFTAVTEQTGNKKLTGINYSVDTSDEPEVEIKLVYSNFGNGNNELSSRLKLDTLLIKADQDDKYKTYSFDYTNLTLPDKNSKRIDHWGFFNGAYNSSLLPNVNYGGQWLGGDADRNVNHANSGACMIKKITYPTGGYSEFVFEGNQYTRPTVPADIMDSTQVSHMIDYESTPFEVSINDHLQSLINNNAIIFHNFKLVGVLEDTLVPNEFNPQGKIEIIRVYDNIVIGALDLVLSGNSIISTGELIIPYLDLRNFQYTLRLELSDPSLSTKLTGKLHCYFYDSDLLATPTNVDGSGRRIAKILHYDPVNDSTTTRSYEYEGYSVTSYAPSYNTETLSHSGIYCGQTSYIISIHSNAQHGLGNSFSNVAYKKVIEYFGDKQSNKGKKETFFKTISDDQTGYGAPFFGRMSYQWVRSLVNTEIVFKTNQDGTFDTVVLTQNYYSQIPNLDYKIRTFKASRKRQLSCSYIPTKLMQDEFYYNNYDYRIENLKIDSTLTKEFFYDASGNGNYSVLSSHTVHEYTNPLIQIPTRVATTNSDEVIRETEYKYPSDFSINDCYEDCMGNYKSALISCENSVDTCMTELGACQSIWATAWSIFLNCQHDNYLAWKNHPLKLVGAGRKDCHKEQKDYLQQYGYYDCLANIDCAYLACYLGVLNTYQVCVEGIKNCIHEKYTNATNPFEKALHYLAWLNLRNKPAERSQIADDVLIDRYKWYYDVFMTGDTIPLLHSIDRDVPGEGFVMELEVLAYDSRNNIIHEKRKQEGQDVAYIWGLNFSYPIARVENAMQDQVYYEGFEEHENGELFLSSGIGLSKSGRKALNSGNFTFPAEFQPPAGVRLSYWYYQNNKWNYYEGGFNQVINSGGSWLDEIRVFPPNSLMLTYAFDGFGRLISSTDERNITTYYQYDHLGRLILVRDDNGNILKQYEYNYAN